MDRGADADLNSAICLHPGRRQITIPRKGDPSRAAPPSSSLFICRNRRWWLAPTLAGSDTRDENRRSGSVTSALEPLRMARNLDPYRETPRMALEPWLVEAALARLSQPLSPADQRIVA